MHIAMFRQKVELPSPVIAHRKQIDIMRDDVFRLLIPGVFRNNQIHVTNRLEERLSLFVGKVRLLALARVKLIRRKTDNKEIPKFFRPLQEPDMTEVQSIKGPVGQNFFQNNCPRCYGLSQREIASHPINLINCLNLPNQNTNDQLPFIYCYLE